MVWSERIMVLRQLYAAWGVRRSGVDVGGQQGIGLRRGGKIQSTDPILWKIAVRGKYMNDVVITAVLRTAVGKFNGSIAKVAAADSGAQTIRALLALSGVPYSANF
jgi:hypothetical protein